MVILPNSGNSIVDDIKCIYTNNQNDTEARSALINARLEEVF